MGANDLVVPEDADSKGAVGGEVVFAPGEGEEGWFGEPGLGVDDCFHEVLEAGEGGGHGA